MDTFITHLRRGWDISLSAGEILNRWIGATKDNLYNRISIVENGYEVCRTQSCDIGGKNWEDWSTPGRDARIVTTFSKAKETYEANKNPKTTIVWLVFLEEKLEIKKKKIKYKQLLLIFLENRFSSDPRDPIQKRWGL